MAAVSENPFKGIRITKVSLNVFPDRNGRAFHFVTDDPRFTHPEGQPGLRFVAESNPLSANYNPREFNRAVRALEEQGTAMGVSWPIVPEHDRQLDNRLALIVKYLRNGGSW